MCNVFGAIIVLIAKLRSPPCFQQGSELQATELVLFTLLRQEIT